jgi:hypothetical protein
LSLSPVLRFGSARSTAAHAQRAANAERPKPKLVLVMVLDQFAPNT